MVTNMAEPTSSKASPAADSDLGLLDRIIQEGRMANEPSQADYAKTLLGTLAGQLLDEDMKFSPDKGVVAMINERVAQIDQLLTDQVNAIMHHPDFQALEGSWQGLKDLVFGSETSTRLKLRLMVASKKELLADLESAVDYDMSVLFKKVYEEEYGTFGGHPYSMLLGDYYFGRHPQDIALLERISKVAAAAHAPFVASAAPALFDMRSFTEVGTPRDFSKIFESAELVAWNGFRESEDSRYVALVLPRYASRLPYGEKTRPVDRFAFEEDVDGKDHSKYLWTNACYLLGLRVTEAFAKYGWTTAIRGVEGGGKVEGMTAHTFKTDEGDIVLKCPTEVTITDRREKELNDLGFIAVVNSKGSNFAAFFGGQTVNKPKTYDKDAANANANLSSRLPYILAASRFAHYIKVIIRDKVGSFQTKDSIEKYLNNWISGYVCLNAGAPQDIKAKLPLASARIDVSEIAGRPGAYQAVVFVRPHFQMEELKASIRMVAELPAPAA
jgi:type VI secretion system protein ImpC